MKLEDIARKAGVSRSTVSRVINGEAYVSEETRSRVMAVIEAENFAPNPAARMLVTQRTQILGIVIPDTLQDILTSDNPYYYSTVLQGITDTTHVRDYATLLWVGHAEEEEDRYYQRILKNRLMDGLVLVAAITNEESLIARLLDSGVPFVLIGRPTRYADQVTYVSIDNGRAVQQAVQHLVSLGRQRIATITGTPENIDAQERLIGYRSALKLAGLPYDPNLVVEGRFGHHWGYVGMKRLLAHRPDALFAASDMIAFGAMQAINEAGLRVPEDISIVGFDDIPLASQTTPPLTTVRQPIAQKAVQAANLLMDLVEGRVEGVKQVLLPTQLVIRQSCGYRLTS